MKDAGGKLVSRSVYWPRSLRLLADEAVRRSFREAPKQWPELPRGPWLKPAVAARRTSLGISLIEERPSAPGRSVVRLRVANAGELPAFPVKIDIEGGRRAFFATDNFFWLAPGESREISAEVLWRDSRSGRRWKASASAWNAETVTAALSR